MKSARKIMVLVSFVMFICGCGGSGSDTASSGTGTGEIRFRILAPGSPVTVENDDKSRVSVIADFMFSPSIAIAGYTENCNSDRYMFEAVVTDSTGATIASGGPWPCSAHRGSVKNVPAGANRKVVIQAKNAKGRRLVVYHGNKDGIQVAGGGVSDAGDIKLNLNKDNWLEMSDGELIYYEKKGQGDALIFIHGEDQASQAWDPQFDEFSKNYQVIRYDIRGYGESQIAKQNTDPPVRTPDDLWKAEQRITTDLLDIVNQLGIQKANICGLSMGSFIANQFATFHPDRVNKMVIASPMGINQWSTNSSIFSGGNITINNVSEWIDVTFRSSSYTTPELIDNTMVISGDKSESDSYMEWNKKNKDISAPFTTKIASSQKNCNMEQPDEFNDFLHRWLSGDIKIVNFPDKTLENLIRLTIQKSKGNIFNEELKNISQLNVNEYKIKEEINDLSGLEYCINLSLLWLFESEVFSGGNLNPKKDNNIKDINPLKKLDQLKTLMIGRSEIIDITPLENLINLRELDLSNNKINYIKPLENLKKIETLYLNGNDISDIGYLYNLKDLKILRLSSNNINDIRPLEDLKSLVYLYLNNNQIKETIVILSPVSMNQFEKLVGLTNLKHINLSNNLINNISHLEKLSNLTSLDIRNNPIDNNSCSILIPQLQSKGVNVTHDCQ